MHLGRGFGDYESRYPLWPQGDYADDCRRAVLNVQDAESWAFMTLTCTVRR